MNTSEIMVSVFMITYNHENYICQAIESIIHQVTNFKFELLIHDDASLDNTGSILREYEKKYPDIIRVVIQEKNQFSQGVKVITKYLLPLARGKYIALCEGDDYWLDVNKLQKQVDYLEMHPEIPAVGSRYHIVDKHGKPEGISHENETTNRLFTKEDALRLGAGLLHPNSVMMRSWIRRSPQYLQGEEKCCILGGHTYMIYYLTSISPVYIFEDIMAAWRRVREIDGTSYTSRSAQYSITYSVKLLDMYKRYQNFFGKKFDFSNQISKRTYGVFRNICTVHEEGANKFNECKKVLRILDIKDYLNFVKWMMKRLFAKIKR